MVDVLIVADSGQITTSFGFEIPDVLRPELVVGAVVAACYC